MEAIVVRCTVGVDDGRTRNAHYVNVSRTTVAGDAKTTADLPAVERATRAYCQREKSDNSRLNGRATRP
jgi:hypothetical protein